MTYIGFKVMLLKINLEFASSLEDVCLDIVTQCYSLYVRFVRITNLIVKLVTRKFFFLTFFLSIHCGKENYVILLQKIFI